MAILDEDDQEDKIKTSLNMMTEQIRRRFPMNVLHLIYEQVNTMKFKITMGFHKIILKPSELKGKGKEVYRMLLKRCPTDTSMLELKKIIDDGVVRNMKKISGRTIDTLVTRYPRFRDVCYYLDVTDPKHTEIVKVPNIPGRIIMLFDIGSSYRKKMQQLSKTYFDCFGRGEEVEHRLKNGSKICISLCQCMFFIWATRFKVFDFLEDCIEPVVIVRQQSQKNNYKPKKRRRKRKTGNNMISVRLSNSVLCPDINHQSKKRKLSRSRVMKPSPQNRQRDHIGMEKKKTLTLKMLQKSKKQ